MEVACNLNELLKYAPRTRLGFTDEGDSEELPSQLDDPTLIGAAKSYAVNPKRRWQGSHAILRSTMDLFGSPHR